MIYQTVVFILVINEWHKVWTSQILNLKKHTTCNQNLTMKMTSAKKVINTTIVLLMKTNNSYLGHFSIWQSVCKVVHKFHHLSSSFHELLVTCMISVNNVIVTCSDGHATKTKSVHCHEMWNNCVHHFLIWDFLVPQNFGQTLIFFQIQQISNFKP